LGGKGLNTGGGGGKTVVQNKPSQVGKMGEKKKRGGGNHCITFRIEPKGGGGNYGGYKLGKK